MFADAQPCITLNKRKALLIFSGIINTIDMTESFWLTVHAFALNHAHLAVPKAFIQTLNDNKAKESNSRWLVIWLLQGSLCCLRYLQPAAL